MLRLAAMIFIFAAPTVMGIFVTAFLTMDRHTTDGMGLVWVALAGLIVALPVSWFAARQVDKLTRKT